MDLAWIASQALPLLLGAVGGGVLSALVTWRMLRADTARRLLANALTIQGEMEGWILEGPGCERKKMSEQPDLGVEHAAGALWLRPVEVRAVLDQAKWNSPKQQLYGFISGRRSWIVRDVVTAPEVAYSGPSAESCRPALLSSRGMEELCGWAEQVALARDGWLLSKRGLAALRPLLLAICTRDRMEVLGDRLSEKARRFLEEYSRSVPQVEASNCAVQRTGGSPCSPSGR